MFHILEDVLDWLGVHPHIDLGVKWGELGLGLLILAPFVWKTCRMFRTMAATTAAMNQRDADADRAIDRMRDEALAQGATAIVGFRMETSAIMNGASEIVAYGTAVVLR